MKSQNYNAKITNDEKNCPESDAPVKNESVPVAIPDADPATSETFIYSEHLLIPSLLRFAGAIYLIVNIASSFKNTEFLFMFERTVLASLIWGAVALFLIFRGISAIIQERKCFLCITPEKIYGKIPSGFFNVKEIDIPTANIIAVNKSNWLGALGIPFFFVYLKILTKESETEIDASSRTMLIKISKTVLDYIRKYK